MVSTFTEVRKEGNSGPSAEKSSNSNRGGNFSLVSREPSDEGTYQKPTRGRHVPDKRQLLQEESAQNWNMECVNPIQSGSV